MRVWGIYMYISFPLHTIKNSLVLYTLLPFVVLQGQLFYIPLTLAAPLPPHSMIKKEDILYICIIPYSLNPSLTILLRIRALSSINFTFIISPYHQSGSSLFSPFFVLIFIHTASLLTLLLYNSQHSTSSL